ncbi:MAG: sulfatase [bacterium]
MILISLDTLRPDHMSCYGYQRQTTPNIDQMASSGALFLNGLSSSSWTLPAHVSMLTGKNSSAIQNSFARGEVTMLAEVLSSHGYETAAFTGGGYISKDFGFSKGFDTFFEAGNWADILTDQAEDHDLEKIYQGSRGWLKERQTKKDPRPFFLFFHTYEPHVPYTHREFLGDEQSVRIGPKFTVEALFRLRDKSLTPTEQEKKYITALYDGDIRFTDAYVGKLLHDLDSMQLGRRTIVILTSDHGEEFWEHYPERSADHGHSLYDNLIKIPLIIRAPGFRFPKKVIASQARSIDIFPTILDLLGIEDGPHVDGESLLPLMHGENRPERLALSEETEFGPERKSLRDGVYKFIYIPDPKKIKRNADLGELNQFELFNIKNDPDEKSNIADENPSVIDHFSQLLVQIMQNAHALPAPPDHRRDISPETREKLKSLGYL